MMLRGCPKGANLANQAGRTFAEEGFDSPPGPVDKASEKMAEATDEHQPPDQELVYGNAEIEDGEPALVAPWLKEERERKLFADRPRLRNRLEFLKWLWEDGRG